MTEHTPTTEEVRTAAHNGAFFPLFRDPADFDRWLSAHDAEVRAQGHHVVPCARCGQKPVVANDALNSDIVVCGDCGVQIGLHELPEVRASVVAEEQEWEYGFTSNWGTHAARDQTSAQLQATTIRTEIEAGRTSGDLKFSGRVMKRAKAGEWLPVEQEKP